MDLGIFCRCWDLDEDYPDICWGLVADVMLLIGAFDCVDDAVTD
jgi:hypothetical protein